MEDWEIEVVNTLSLRGRGNLAGVGALHLLLSCRRIRIRRGRPRQWMLLGTRAGMVAARGWYCYISSATCLLRVSFLVGVVVVDLRWAN